MDFQHRPGGKTGSGGVASSSESNRDRRERLRQLALETIDINKVGHPATVPQLPPSPGLGASSEQGDLAWSGGSPLPPTAVSGPAVKGFLLCGVRFCSSTEPVAWGARLEPPQAVGSGQQRAAFSFATQPLADRVSPGHC